jgi:hypothetical protein
MSGGHAALVNHSGKHIDCPKLRAAFTDVATFVLDSQFVAIMDPDGHIGHTYKVVSGTGMGLRSSGHLSNVAFWSMVEKNFCADKEVQKNYGILAYYRYMDDGFFVHRGSFSMLMELRSRMCVSFPISSSWSSNFREFRSVFSM